MVKVIQDMYHQPIAAAKFSMVMMILDIRRKGKIK
jgi:hypothetical protein